MKKLQTDIMIELHVPSFETAKEFYSALGYEVVWENKPHERKGYMVMRNGDSILNFYCGNDKVYEQDYFKKFPRNTERGYGVEIVIPVDDIEELYKRIEESIYKDKIVGELKKRFDRLDFRMVDPFGFYLRFVERYDWVNDRDKEGNKI